MDDKVIIRVTEEFSKKYKELPKYIQRKLDKQLKNLANNPKHPSLRIHKMNEEWEFYVDKKYRCILLKEGKLYTLLTVGGHKIVNRFRN